MPVPITEGGKTGKVTTAEAVLLRLREMALQGKNHAMDRLLKLWLDSRGEEGNSAGAGGGGQQK